MKKALSPFAVVVAIILGFAAPMALAGTDTWNGGSATGNYWSDPNNWGGTGVLSGDSLIFDGSLLTSNTNDLTPGILLGNIMFNSTASAFNLYTNISGLSGGSITLSNAYDSGGGEEAGGGIYNAEGTSANNQAIFISLKFAAGNHFVSNGSTAGNLNLSGTITRSPGATVIFTNNSATGFINVSGSGLANDASGILGGWAIISNDWAALDGSGNVVDYTGYKVLTGGAINISSGATANDNVQISGTTANPTAQSSATINTIEYADTLTTNRTLTLSTGVTLKLGGASHQGAIYRTGAAGAANFIVSGGTALTVSGGGELTVADAPIDSDAGGSSNTPRLQVASVIADDGANLVTVNTVGYIALNAANTFSGGLYVNEGSVNTATGAAAANAFGANGNNVHIFPGGSVYIRGVNSLSTPVTYAQNFFIAGAGATGTAGNQGGYFGVLQFRPNTANDQQIISGTVTLMGNSIIGLGSGANATISGQVTGNGLLAIQAGINGTGTNILSNSGNNWTGGLNISAVPLNASRTSDKAVVKLGANALPGSGNVTLTSSSNPGNLAILDLFGNSTTINGLISAGAAQTNLFVDDTAASTSPTLTVGSANNVFATFAGNIQNSGSGAALSLTKIGTGTQVLNGTNSYTGATTISGGTLLIGGVTSNTAISIGNGALGGAGVVGSVSTTAAGAQLNQESNFLATSSVGTLTLNGALSMGAGGSCYLDLSGSHLFGNDLIVVSGAATLNGNTFHINAMTGGGNLDAGGDYILIQAGSISGTVNSTPAWDGTVPANSSSYAVKIIGNNVVLHNSTFAGPEILAATATPSTITRFQSTVISVTVTNGTPPYTVTADTSSIGGSSSFNLVRDTSKPAGVYVYTNSVTPAPSTISGNYTLPVTATDNAFLTANANISLTVVGASLTWNGDPSGNSYWDTGGELEWQGGLTYAQGDMVRFDDSATGVNATNVNLLTTLSPGSVTVSNTAALPTANYNFTGGGYISGPTSLIKQGSGTLALTETGGDSFTGGVVVGGGTLIMSNVIGGLSGTLQVTNGTLVLAEAGTISGTTIIGSGGSLAVGNNGTLGSLPSGGVTMNGVLAFNKTSDFSVANLISGASTGTLIQSNVNVVTLTAANTFTGNILVSSGTLSNSATPPVPDPGTSGGFGASTIPGRIIAVSPGATISGALNNWFGDKTLVDANFPSIYLTGGTAFGSRYTAIGNVALTNGATLMMNHNGNGKDGGLYFDFQFRGSITVGGTSPSTITNGDGWGDHLNTNTLFNVAITSGSGPDLIVGCPLLNCSGDYTNAPGVPVVASLTKAGPGRMLLTATATNAYSGSTTINAGTLALTNSGYITNSSGIVIAGGATLDVSGLSAPSFALVASQTVSNSSGTAVISGVADLSAGTLSLTYGGTPSLLTTNGSVNLAAGTAITINNTSASPLSAGAYTIITNAASGNVGTVIGAAPTTVTVTGTGLAAGATAALQINSGRLNLVVTGGTLPPPPTIQHVLFSSGNIIFTGTNNNGSGGTYHVLVSTNIAAHLSNWIVLTNGTFNTSGNFAVTNTIGTNARQFFILQVP